MIKITTKDQISQSLATLIKRGENIHPLLNSIAAQLISTTQERFMTMKKDPTGKPWQALKPQTLAEKRKKGKVGGILIRNQQLFSSLTHQINRNELLVGTNKKYAKYHQFGSKIHPDYTYPDDHANKLKQQGNPETITQLTLSTLTPKPKKKANDTP